jgi:3-hydroxy-9,10-secoandrosta-1,3,5(10)-triene-9,17-dione monooxygenase reductase component
VGAIDPQEFRTAAGQFMTGVTIVTTLDGGGRPSGLTANSFCSVSLHPPLILFSLGRDSTNLEAFEAQRGFVTHVLAADQRELSIHFAAKGIDRFEHLDWSPGVGGLPVIPGALATFECSPHARFDGGDHILYVGEVERLTLGDVDQDALGYFRSRYVTSPPPT